MFLPDVNYALHDGVAIVVNEWERSGLVSDGQRELVVVHQTNFLNLRRVVDVVEKAGDAEDFRLFSASDLDGRRPDLNVDLGVLVGKLQRVVEDLQILVERQSCARKLLLVWSDVVI